MAKRHGSCGKELRAMALHKAMPEKSWALNAGSWPGHCLIFANQSKKLASLNKD
jgi:hypothetical protein